MHDGHGYGVRIRRPPDAADEWAADLALIIAPIIGESPDDLEDALLSGILVVAQGLPYDEAKQLVDVFIGLGAQADVVDVPPEPDLAPGMGSLSGLMPQVGDGPPPRIAGTQPFSVAGLRRALEAAQRPPPVAEPPPPDAFAPPPMAPPPGAFAPPPVATRTSTRPFAASARKPARRIDEGPGLLEDEGDDRVPTRIMSVAPRESNRRPTPAGTFNRALFGVIAEQPDDRPPGLPGATQSFGAAMLEPPPPPVAAPMEPEERAPARGPAPIDEAGPRRGELAGFAPTQRFDPSAISRLRDDRPARQGGASPTGPQSGLGAPAAEPAARPVARGAAIGDKPTDRLVPPASKPAARLVDRGTLPQHGGRVALEEAMAELGGPSEAAPRQQGPRTASGPMVVQLAAPSLDPAETGTFTREASLDPLSDLDEGIRPVDRRRAAVDLPVPDLNPPQALRPGVYRLPGHDRAAVEEAPIRNAMPPSVAGRGAIFATGQMPARVVSRPDEELTDSGSFKIVRAEELDEPVKKRQAGPTAAARAHQPAQAALLSLVLPGMGQVYNGQRDRGLWFALLAVLVVPWLYAIADAWKVAAQINAGERPAPDPAIWRVGRWGQLMLNLAVLFGMVVGISIWRGSLQHEPPPAPSAPSAP